MCNPGQHPSRAGWYVRALAQTDRAELRRLTLQIERDLLSQARLRALLVGAGATVAGRQQDLRALKARLARVRRRGSLE